MAKYSAPFHPWPFCFRDERKEGWNVAGAPKFVKTKPHNLLYYPTSHCVFERRFVNGSILIRTGLLCTVASNRWTWYTLPVWTRWNVVMLYSGVCYRTNPFVMYGTAYLDIIPFKIVTQKACFVIYFACNLITSNRPTFLCILGATFLCTFWWRCWGGRWLNNTSTRI